MTQETPVAPLTQPITDAITITLAPSQSHEPWRVARSRLETALRSRPDVPTKGWRVRRVRYTRVIIYDLLPPTEVGTPPEPYTLPPATAWDLTYALRGMPDVLEAEPSFATLQDAHIAPAAPAAAPSPALAAPAAFEPCNDDEPPATVDPRLVDWSVRLVDAPCAWELDPPDHGAAFARGKIKGEGIRVGHPDSGYKDHTDLKAEPPGQPPRVLGPLERDFIDGDHGPNSARDPNGQHGLSTGSFIMSSDMTGRIVGLAPKADIVPLRVTKPRGMIPAPILFDSGARALRDAVRYAATVADCHVISISLGWFYNRGLHDAVREAEAANVIVCAAAGNYTPLVVWPAAHAEVVAVGGCNAMRQPWSGSARGSTVDVSGPAEDVWVASFTSQGIEAPAQTNGTSFGVATVAGVAALWLAYHNREFLLDRYKGQFTLTDVFRVILGMSSDSFADPGAAVGLGVGIVNARKVLKTPLPTLTEMQQMTPAVAFLAAPDTPVGRIAAAFPDIAPAVLEQWLAANLGIPAQELNERLDGMEDEIIFQIATDEEQRNRLAASSGLVTATPATPAAAPVAPDTAPPSGSSLRAAPLSDALRSRLQ
jgi:hypothetical protein